MRVSSAPVPHPNRSVAALVAGAIAIGFAPIFVRLSEVGPTATAFWRVTLALPGLLLWAGLTRTEGTERRERQWRPVAMAGFCFAGDLAAWHISILFTSVANATLEANLASVLVVLYGWLVLRHRVKRSFLFAMALSLFGTMLLVGRNAHLSATTLRGDAWGMLTACFYAGYLMSVKAARNRHWPAGAIMAVSGVVTVAILFPLAWWTESRLLPVSVHGWLLLLGLAFFSHLGGQGLIAYALKDLPAAFASLALLVQPAAAAIAAWAILHETLSTGQLLGGVILLAGLYLARQAN